MLRVPMGRQDPGVPYGGSRTLGGVPRRGRTLGSILAVGRGSPKCLVSVPYGHDQPKQGLGKGVGVSLCPPDPDVGSHRRRTERRWWRRNRRRKRSCQARRRKLSKWGARAPLGGSMAPLGVAWCHWGLWGGFMVPLGVAWPPLGAPWSHWGSRVGPWPHWVLHGPTGGSGVGSWPHWSYGVGAWPHWGGGVGTWPHQGVPVPLGGAVGRMEGPAGGPHPGSTLTPAQRMGRSPGQRGPRGGPSLVPLRRGGNLSPGSGRSRRPKEPSSSGLSWRSRGSNSWYGRGPRRGWDPHCLSTGTLLPMCKPATGTPIPGQGGAQWGPHQWGHTRGGCSGGVLGLGPPPHP